MEWHLVDGKCNSPTCQRGVLGWLFSVGIMAESFTSASPRAAVHPLPSLALPPRCSRDRAPELLAPMLSFTPCDPGCPGRLFLCFCAHPSGSLHHPPQERELKEAKGASLLK